MRAHPRAAAGRGELERSPEDGALLSHRPGRCLGALGPGPGVLFATWGLRERASGQRPRPPLRAAPPLCSSSAAEGRAPGRARVGADPDSSAVTDQDGGGGFTRRSRGGGQARTPASALPDFMPTPPTAMVKGVSSRYQNW